jgi:hypothetical protein
MVMRERRLPNSPWDYKLEVVSSLEHPEDAHVNLDLTNYTLMAYELADTIKIENPLINKIIYLPGSGHLASYVSDNNSINTYKRIDLEDGLIEDLRISTYDRVLILANENKDGQISALSGSIKAVFKPREIVTAVLFENPDVLKRADFVVYETSCKINFPVEVMEYASKTELLLISAEELASLLLADIEHSSLDWRSATEQVTDNLGFSLPISLKDYHFASIMLFALKDRYKSLFDKELSNELAKKLLPGITEEVFK